MSWCILFDSLTGTTQVRDTFAVLFNLSVAVASMEQSLEVGVSTFDVFQSFREVLDGGGEVHESGVN